MTGTCEPGVSGLTQFTNDACSYLPLKIHSLIHTIMARRLRASLLVLQMEELKKLVHPVAVPSCVATACFPEQRPPQARLVKCDVVQQGSDTSDGEDEKNEDIVSCLALRATFEREHIICFFVLLRLFSLFLIFLFPLVVAVVTTSN